MRFSFLTLVSTLGVSRITSAVLEIQVTEITYFTDDCSGNPAGGDIHFPFTGSCGFFNEKYPNSLYVAWSDISESPAMLVQFLINNSTCILPGGSTVDPDQDLYIVKEGCYNLTGLYDKERVTGLAMMPLVVGDAAVPE